MFDLRLSEQGARNVHVMHEMVDGSGLDFWLQEKEEEG